MNPATPPRVLVIDDGVEYARIVQEHLPEFELIEPYGSETPARIPDGPAAIEFLRQRANEVDVVLLDMRFEVDAERILPLSDRSSSKRDRRFQGIAILRALRSHHPELPVVLLTAQRDLALADAGDDLASQSMTYVLDGDDLDTLRIRINTAYQNSQMSLADGEMLWGRAPQMRSLRRRLSTLARGTLPVLLEGETGTGKSYLAERLVHRASGRNGPFVIADLASIPKDHIAAHQFGATRGSYTGDVNDRQGVFELADGGTLFLDEIQNVPLDVQRQLLVVLQERRVRPLGAARERQVDVKVIASSNEALDEAVRSGRFRQDLYMRLGPATRVVIPPLRERLSDLEFFVHELVAKATDHPEIAPLHEIVADAAGVPAGGRLMLRPGKGRGRSNGDVLALALPDAGWKLLSEHRWPGNMRELAFVVHNVITFTLVEAADAIRAGLPMSSSRLQIDPGLVAELLRGSTSTIDAKPAANDEDDRIAVQVRPGETLNGVSVEVERQYFLELFRRYDGDFAQMALHLLGDEGKARAVQLRFNQIGLKVRQLRRR
ncbi:MAG: sigma 54-interacting transcriptional regulator [Myxococcota bacterium]